MEPSETYSVPHSVAPLKMHCYSHALSPIHEKHVSLCITTNPLQHHKKIELVERWATNKKDIKG